MPAIDASIPLGVKAPDGMTTFGNMLNMARGAQALQLGNVELQKNDIALQERKGIQQLFSNPDALKGADGQMDYNKLIEEGMKVAPTTFPTMLPQIIQAKKLGVEAEQALTNLNESTRAGAGQWFMAQRGKPLEQVAAEAAEIKRLNPALAPAIDSSLKVLTIAGKGGQAALDSAYMKLGQAAMSPGQQAAAMTPSGVAVSSGTESSVINTNPVAAPVGSTIPGTAVRATVPPTQAQTTRADVLGNAYIEEKRPDGSIVNKPAPGSGAPPLLHFPPGESPQSAQALTSARTEVNQAASKVPEQHFNNKQIEKLADTALTGTGAQTWSKAFSTMGLQWTPGDATANYQQLGHFMALQSQANAKAMSAGTDAARGISEQATGSTAWDAKAIKRATKINDALSTGVDYFNRGMEAAINSPDNQKSIFAARDFQNAWSQTFDVNAMRLHNAIQAGDKEEQKAVVDSVGGKNSPGARNLASKMRALDKLISEGHL